MSLPWIYNRIAAAAGIGTAAGLARARGGERVYVPKDLRIASWLTEAMGAAGAAALIDMYGGEAIELPLDPFNENSPRARARRIAEAIDAGLSCNQIARAEGVTRRAVLRHIAKRRAA